MDALPAADRVRRGVAARTRVAHDAPDQPVVGRGDAVVPVDVELRQRRDVDTEDPFGGDARHQARIQAVDALNQQHLVGTQLDHAPPLALACDKVVAGQLDLLAGHQRSQLLVEKRQVQCLQHLEVVVALLVARGQLAIYEVVVQLDRDRPHTIGKQLHGQPLRKGRLA